VRGIEESLDIILNAAVLLIVEDDPGMQEYLRVLLEAHNYTCIFSPDAESALKVVEKQSVDLILLDFYLSGKNGIEFCLELRKKPERKHIPVLFVSAADDVEIITQAFKVGGVDYILKPFHAEEVLARIKTHLLQKKVYEDLQDTLVSCMEEFGEQGEKYKSFLEHSLDGFWHYNIDPPMPLDIDLAEQKKWILEFSALFEVNEAHISALRYPERNSIIGKSLAELSSMGETMILEAFLNSFITNNFHLENQEFVKEDNGQARVWVQTSLLGLIKNRKLTDIWGSSTDISKRKRNERARDSVISLFSLQDSMDLNSILQTALNNALELTESKIGYIHFVNEENDEFAFHSVVGEYDRSTNLKDMHLPISSGGLWTKCIKEKRPVIINDYQGYPDKQGLADNHMALARFLSVPVFEDGICVVTLGVGNRADNYTQEDADLLTYLTENVWNIVRRKRTEDQLRVSLSEKEVLLKELYHRTKNNMQIISSMLDIKGSSMPESHFFRTQLKEVELKIQAMSLVHEQLYESENLSMIDLEKYVKDLLQHCIASYSSQMIGISMQFEGESVLVVMEIAVSLGLVLSELITNSLKHGFASDGKGKISIVYSMDDELTLHLTYHDSGKGIEKDAFYNSKEGIGLEIVKSTIHDQLKGRYALKDAPGFTLDIVIPLDSYQSRV
jgi:two-component sensor histidine kinase/CheY-like chemotaxis protein